MNATIRHDGARPDPALDSQARFWLRLEGLAALIAAVAIFARLGGDLIWFVPLLLVPDISAIGYLKGPVAGAAVYNAFHNWAVGLAVLGAGLAFGVTPVAIAGAILIGHTGMDRTVGYGLKLRSGFGDTHLGNMGKARSGAGPAGSEGASPATANRQRAAQ